MPAQAFANEEDEEYQPRFVPQCTVYILGDGTEICGFNDIEDWKGVLWVDAERANAREQLKNTGMKIANLTLQVHLLEGQVDVCEKGTIVLHESNTKLISDIVALDRKYQFERSKPRWGEPLAWTLSAISTSVLAGFLINDIVD